ncbi:hypothetical protein [Streptomyces sp. WAC06614]|uniref:hypothetical protein n=1 Tax=Streptomyces sp. WAC06614 TaxID=2487416 RepID=UPI000F7B3B4A|nr:hypothetical protein [Streptomyces sp. WAC06614]RSS84308.1 hypothetical protein EF918_00910 [Streptomyces sp. WAC06614]
MAKIVPRQVIVDGVQLVALTEQEYESLAASRRQFGSHVVRLRMTREALTSLTRVAGAMCALLRAGEVPAEAPHDGPDAPRQPPKGLLSALEAAVEQAQRVIGKQPDASPGSARGPGRKR